MLILRRQEGEGIVLGESIHVVVLGIEGNRVKIGIDAPVDVHVVRDELLDDGQRFARPQRVYRTMVPPEDRREPV